MDNSYELWSLYKSPSKRSAGVKRRPLQPRMEDHLRAQSSQMSDLANVSVLRPEESENGEGGLTKLGVENLKLKIENTGLASVVSQQKSRIRELSALVANLTAGSDIESSNSQAEHTGSNSSKSAKIQRVTPTKRQLSSSATGSLRRRLFQDSPNAVSGTESDENRQVPNMNTMSGRVRTQPVVITPSNSRTPSRSRGVADSLSQRNRRNNTPETPILQRPSPIYHADRIDNTPVSRAQVPNERRQQASLPASRRIAQEQPINNNRTEPRLRHDISPIVANQPRRNLPRRLFPEEPSEETVLPRSPKSLRHSESIRDLLSTSLRNIRDRRTTPANSVESSPRAVLETTNIAGSNANLISFTTLPADNVRAENLGADSPENGNAESFVLPIGANLTPFNESAIPTTSTPITATFTGAAMKMVKQQRFTADEFFGTQSRKEAISPSAYDIRFPRLPHFEAQMRQNESQPRKEEDKTNEREKKRFEVEEKERTKQLAEHMVSMLEAVNITETEENDVTPLPPLRTENRVTVEQSTRVTNTAIRNRSGSSSSTANPLSSASLSSSQSTGITTDAEFNQNSRGSRKSSAVKRVAPVRRPPTVNNSQASNSSSSDLANRHVERNLRQDRSNEPHVEWLQSSHIKPQSYTPARSLQSFFLANRQQTCQRMIERSEKRQRVDSLRKNIIKMKKKAAKDVATGVKTADDVQDILFCDTTKIRAFNERTYKNFTKRKHHQFTDGTNPQLRQYKKDLHKGVSLVMLLEHNLRVRNMARQSSTTRPQYRLPRSSTFTWVEQSRPGQPRPRQPERLRVNGFTPSSLSS